ncbi:MAG: hypothetical protein M1383_00790 [Patescibacteria group bacterium]|nr:hypothetical protein [Patescibacteria group bacterium]
MDQTDQKNGNNNTLGLRREIMEKIKHGEVRMRSKAYFIWQALAVAAAVVLLLLLAVAIASFLIFVLHASGRIFLPSFGWQGWRLFLLRFPWLILLLIAALVVILEILVKRFAYRRPFIYSLGSILAVILVAGIFVGQSSLHPVLFNQASENQLPLAGGLYRYFEQENLEEIHHGIISNINQGGFTLNTKEEPYSVIPNDQVMLDNLYNGDRVFVLGEESNGQIHAFGIKKVGKDELFRKIWIPGQGPNMK